MLLLFFIKKYVIINYKRMKERKKKMINAKDAHKRTLDVVKQMQEKAKQWVENEWEFVENKIQEAIEKGEFEATYWWSSEILEEAGVKKSYAAEALAEKAYDLGFIQKTWQNWGNCCVLMIELRWEKV